MTFCQNCGHGNDEGAKFCVFCGKGFFIADTDQPENTMFTNDGAQTVFGARRAAWAASALSDAQQAVKSAGASNLMLASAVIVSMQLLLNLLSIFRFNLTYSVGQLDLFRAPLFYGIEEGIYEAGMGLMEGMNLLQGLIRSFMFMGLIPTILICVGLWMFVLASRRGDVKTLGLSLLKGVAIYNIVMVAVVMAIFAVLSVVIIAAMQSFSRYSYGYNEEAIALVAVIIAIVIVIAALVLPLLYYIFALKTVDTVKMTVITGKPSDKVSPFVAVYGCISAGIGLLFSLFSLDAASVLTSLLNGTFMVIAAVMIFSYRKTMREIMYGAPPRYY